MKILEAERPTNLFVPIRRVLVAVDLSDGSEATAAYAAKIAECFDASLTIVHVYEPVPICEYASESTFTVLEEQRDDLQKLLDQLTSKFGGYRVYDPATKKELVPSQEVQA